MTDELFEQFIIEGRELVEQASEDLLTLEQVGAAAAPLDSAFRAFHTLKGSVALFDLAPMGAMLHAAEDLLGAMRDGKRAADPEVIGLLLRCVDQCDAWIGTLASTALLPPDAETRAGTLADALRALLPEAPRRQEAAQSDVDWLSQLLGDNAAAVTQAREAGQRLVGIRYAPNADCFFLGDDPIALLRTVPRLVACRIALRPPAAVEGFDPFACNLLIEAVSAATAEEVRGVFRFVADQVTVLPVEDAPAETVPRDDSMPMRSSSLRVDVRRVDALAALVGELIVAKNALRHVTVQAEASDAAVAGALALAYATIDRLAGDMHRAVMDIRMLPLDRIFRRLPRLVREIAGQLGKEVAFEIRGAQTEADKTVIDALFEPLLHVLRNAIDHGIEAPVERRDTGKPPAGRLVLDAHREGERIVVSVTDDGRGIDPVHVRDVARSRGLLDDAALDILDDAAAIDLIFRPGFSTASNVSAISGRGVGMDAVRAAVEGVGGRVTVTSSRGKGTAIAFALPQAVAVTTVVVVRVGAERFGIPVDAVREICRLPADRVLRLGDREAFVLRDRTLPLLRLGRLLGLSAAEPLADARILIATSGGHPVGIAVDAFEERVDVVLRPMADLLTGMRGMRHTALLGNGRVLIVLDLPDLIG